MGHGTMPPADESPAQQPMSGTDHVAMGHAMPQASADADPFYAPGSGLTPRAANGGKFLSSADLKAQKPLYRGPPATRQIRIPLNGNMDPSFGPIINTKDS